MVIDVMTRLLAWFGCAYGMALALATGLMAARFAYEALMAILALGLRAW